ncbi:Wadjet anti-phage system protein JetA family protein [Novosphingobium sp.]|uniref:Wadjet anti-phage system protein JetA family protein n=1 Tax=Novosphingobium sp. TaxID=1874826 RepID=UPI0031E03607
MLFGQLHPDAFTLFSGSNRFLYERVLVGIYEGFFRSDLHFPGENDVVGRIYEELANHPDLWREDESAVVLDELSTRRGRRIRRKGHEAADSQATGEAMARARHIYNRLNATGWLEESHYGLKVTVDMPSGAMRLVEFLCGLREGVSEQIGGIVIQIKNGLEALQRDARDNALGLHKAARDAATFGRYLRSVLSALREIDKQVVDAASVGERLRHYFEDFVERLLLQDYVAITTTSHPYRFRHRILGTIGAIEESLSDVEAIAEAYVEAHLAADAHGARDSVYDDLSKIRRVFDQIEDAFERIQQHRSRLETRLRNTVRYAGRRSGGFLQRSAPLLLKLDKLLLQPLEVDGLLEDRPAPICAALLTRPRHRRPIVAGDVLVLPPPDPLRELRKRLEKGYLDLLAVKPEQVRAFLEARIAPGAQADARDFTIATVEDFLAFEALRLAVFSGITPAQRQNPLSRHLAPDFAFAALPGRRIDNDWLTCSDFQVTRKTGRTSGGETHAR